MSDVVKYIFQVQQTMWGHHDEKDTKWMDAWADIEEFEDREKAVERHERSSTNSRVAAIIETDGQKEGEVEDR